MVIILKIFLAIVSIAFGYISYFVITEFKKFRKSEESEKASMIEKFILGAITFSSISLLVAMTAFCVLMLFSNITISLPF
jgi:uncharacterized membrane protein